MGDGSGEPAESLGSRLLAKQRRTLCTEDYRLDSAVFDPPALTRPRAELDSEMVLLGDPLGDEACSTCSGTGSGDLRKRSYRPVRTGWKAPGSGR